MPRSSVSRVAVRMNARIGLPKRSISSTARGSSVGSATRRSISAGLRASASAPCDSRLRVVSLPATSSVMQNISRSNSSSFSPSISDATSVERMSGPGFTRRSASTVAK